MLPFNQSHRRPPPTSEGGSRSLATPVTSVNIPAVSSNHDVASDSLSLGALTGRSLHAAFGSPYRNHLLAMQASVPTSEARESQGKSHMPFLPGYSGGTVPAGLGLYGHSSWPYHSVLPGGSLPQHSPRSSPRSLSGYLQSDPSRNLSTQVSPHSYKSGHSPHRPTSSGATAASQPSPGYSHSVQRSVASNYPGKTEQVQPCAPHHPQRSTEEWNRYQAMPRSPGQYSYSRTQKIPSASSTDKALKSPSRTKPQSGSSSRGSSKDSASSAGVTYPYSMYNGIFGQAKGPERNMDKSPQSNRHDRYYNQTASVNTQQTESCLHGSKNRRSDGKSSSTVKTERSPSRMAPLDLSRPRPGDKRPFYPSGIPTETVTSGHTADAPLDLSVKRRRREEDSDDDVILVGIQRAAHPTALPSSFQQQLQLQQLQSPGRMFSPGRQAPYAENPLSVPHVPVRRAVDIQEVKAAYSLLGTDNRQAQCSGRSNELKSSDRDKGSLGPDRKIHGSSQQTEMNQWEISKNRSKGKTSHADGAISLPLQELAKATTTPSPNFCQPGMESDQLLGKAEVSRSSSNTGSGSRAQWPHDASSHYTSVGNMPRVPDSYKLSVDAGNRTLDTPHANTVLESHSGKLRTKDEAKAPQRPSVESTRPRCKSAELLGSGSSFTRLPVSSSSGRLSQMPRFKGDLAQTASASQTWYPPYAADVQKAELGDVKCSSGKTTIPSGVEIATEKKPSSGITQTPYSSTKKNYILSSVNTPEGQKQTLEVQTDRRYGATVNSAVHGSSMPPDHSPILKSEIVVKTEFPGSFSSCAADAEQSVQEILAVQPKAGVEPVASDIRFPAGKAEKIADNSCGSFGSRLFPNPGDQKHGNQKVIPVANVQPIMKQPVSEMTPVPQEKTPPSPEGKTFEGKSSETGGTGIAEAELPQKTPPTSGESDVANTRLDIVQKAEDCTVTALEAGLPIKKVPNYSSFPASHQEEFVRFLSSSHQRGKTWGKATRGPKPTVAPSCGMSNPGQNQKVEKLNPKHPGYTTPPSDLQDTDQGENAQMVAPKNGICRDLSLHFSTPKGRHKLLAKVGKGVAAPPDLVPQTSCPKTQPNCGSKKRSDPQITSREASDDSSSSTVPHGVAYRDAPLSDARQCLSGIQGVHKAIVPPPVPLQQGPFSRQYKIVRIPAPEWHPDGGQKVSPCKAKAAGKRKKGDKKTDKTGAEATTKKRGRRKKQESEPVAEVKQQKEPVRLSFVTGGGWGWRVETIML